MSENAGWMATNVDPDQAFHSAATDYSQHYLLGPVCPSTEGKILHFADSSGSHREHLKSWSDCADVQVNMDLHCLPVTH